MGALIRQDKQQFAHALTVKRLLGKSELRFVFVLDRDPGLARRVTNNPAMDCHLREFVIAGRTYGLPDDEDWGTAPRKEAAKLRLRDVLKDHGCMRCTCNVHQMYV